MEKLWNNLSARNSLICNQWKRFYSKAKWKQIERQREVDSTVFQYAGSKRSDRLYVWGYAATGALGNMTLKTYSAS